MSVFAEDPPDVRTDRDRPDRPTRPKDPPGKRPRRAWWLGVLTVVVAFYLGVMVLPVYLTLNPALARIDLNANSLLHYPLLVVHVATGTIAMIAGLLQVWPKLRRKRPRAHRISGRIYVAAVVLGAPALAMLIVFRTQSDGETPTTLVVGFSMLSILWVVTTVAGFQHARQRRFADHRRLMIYSFAMTLSIMWSRFAFMVAMGIPGFDMRWIEENTGWFPWVVNLIFAQWWLNRTARRRTPARTTAARATEAAETR